jgi:hypothetical protein
MNLPVTRFSDGILVCGYALMRNGFLNKDLTEEELDVLVRGLNSFIMEKHVPHGQGIDAVELENYRVCKASLERLGGQPASEGSNLLLVYNATKGFVEAIEMEVGREVLAEHLKGEGLVFNGKVYHMLKEELNALSMADRDGRYPWINAIKEVRARTGLCLSDSRTLVEHYMNKLGLKR